MATPSSPDQGEENVESRSDRPGNLKAQLSEPQPPQDVALAAQATTEQDPMRGKLIQGAVWVASLRWGTVLFSWPVTIFLARLLTPEDYGYLALVAVFTRFASLVAQGGLPSVIVLGEALPERSYQRLHGWSISFYLVAFAALWLIAAPVERAYGIEGLRWVIFSLSFTLLMEGLTLVPMSRMRRDLRLRELPIFDAVAVVANGVFALAGALLGLRYWALVLGYVGGRLAYTILILKAYSLPPAWPRLKGVRKSLREAGNLLVSGTSTFLGESSDAWIGAGVIGASGLGGYKFMTGLARAPLDKISGIFLYVAGSALGTLREDRERLHWAIRRMVRLTATMMFPIFVGIVLVSADLVAALLGEKWMPFLAALQVYCLYAMFLPIRSVLGPAAVSAGASGVVASTGLIVLLILPPSFFLLGDRLGSMGLALAWLLPLPLVIARLVQALQKRIGFGWGDLWDALSLPLLNVSVMAIGVMATDYLPLVGAAHPLTRLVLQSSAGATLYIALVLWLQKTDIRWGIEVAGPQIPARLRRLLERWT